MDHNTYQDKLWTKQIGDSLRTDDLQTRTVDLDMLGGTIASYYHAPWPPNPSNPTLVMINGFGTTADIFRHQLNDSLLTGSVNMLAIEPLGHGKTRTESAEFSNWDSAAMCVEVVKALNITGQVFVTGIGQGGWIAVQMALLAPDRIAGLIPIDTSMDSESERSRKLGCWDAPAELTPYIDAWAKPYVYRIFEPDSKFVERQVSSGLGDDASQAEKDFWTVTMRKHWSGEAGRKRARMSAINLRDRESLHSRLSEITCPVLWLHGSRDSVYSVELAREEIEMFVNSPDKRLEVVDAGTHYSMWSKSEEVNGQLLRCVEQYRGEVGQSSP
jgi:pimeloyl-ACP methyl ester carboxylesterase